MISTRVIREDILRMIHRAGSGHPGGSLSLVEILVHLYWKEMRIDAANPLWGQRDRLILSKGHAAPALYSVLARRGFFPVEKLNGFRRFGSGLEGHPHMQSLPGLDCSTGSLGQGLGIAAGLALGLSLQSIPARVFCILGDGELQEGSVWESAMSISGNRQRNITAIVDRNRVQLDDAVEKVMPLEPLADKWKAFGWKVVECQGHSLDDLERAFAMKSEKPVVIIAETVKGKGVSFMENTALWHGKAPDEEQLERALEELK